LESNAKLRKVRLDRVDLGTRDFARQALYRALVLPALLFQALEALRELANVTSYILAV
jgi:hypothetical protein